MLDNLRLLLKNKRFRYTRSGKRYLKELRAAGSARSILGLDPLPVRFPNPAISPDHNKTELRELVCDALSHTPFAISECVMTSWLIYNYFTEAGIPCYFTIGYVDTPKGPIWKFGRKEMARWHSGEAPANNTVPVHAWLTLRTMEVLDSALVPAIRSINSQESFEHDIIIDHPNHWQSGFVYHPIVIGLDAMPAMFPNNPGVMLLWQY